MLETVILNSEIFGDLTLAVSGEYIRWIMFSELIYGKIMFYGHYDVLSL